jgi:hypothetical protein
MAAGHNMSAVPKLMAICVGARAPEAFCAAVRDSVAISGGY